MGNLTRRDFIWKTTKATIGLTTTGLIPLRCARLETAYEHRERQPFYAFILLGDLHYDRMSHHDMGWVEREKPNDVRQINEYVEITEKYTPRLLARVGEAVRTATTPVPFVIQVGDLTEGLCGSYDLQALQFHDAIAMVEELLPGVPFLVTKGNHDITGPGAAEAYDRVLLPWIGKQIGRDLKSASFSVTHDEDLFVFFDAYKRDLDWLEETLAVNRGRRHVFFVIHPPVVPYNARSSWHIYSGPQEEAERGRLLALLGRCKAIVLSGHLHRYGLITRATPGGSFVQLGLNSVISSEEVKPRQVLEGVEQYGPDLVELEPDFSPDTVEQRRELLKAEGPYIRHFEFADVAGHALFKVFADRVEMEVFIGFEPDVWKHRDLAKVGSLAEKRVLRANCVSSV